MVASISRQGSRKYIRLLSSIELQVSRSTEKEERAGLQYGGVASSCYLAGLGCPCWDQGWRGYLKGKGWSGFCHLSIGWRLAFYDSAAAWTKLVKARQVTINLRFVWEPSLKDRCSPGRLFFIEEPAGGHRASFHPYFDLRLVQSLSDI